MYNTWKIQDGKLIYSCGCKFDIIKEREGQFPLIKPGNPYKNWNYQCEATKMLLGDGNTAGVFQLESFLGKHWTKRLKPESVEHLSALTAIIRPSCLEQKNEKGISVTELYCKYKNNEENPIPLVPEIGYLLENNYFQMIYQEDSMKIAKEIAGLSPAQCDSLRKSMSKKDAELMTKCRIEFVEGCKKTGKVSEEKANLIFDKIQASVRYSFNKSVTETTIVRTINGEKSIKDVKKGDLVKAPLEWKKNHYIEVLNVFDHGIQEVYEATLESGKKIECTLQHKFLCSDNQIWPLGEIWQKKLPIITYTDRVFGESLISLVPIGPRQTYDIEVNSDNHIYYGNGIATSNSHSVSYGILSLVTAFAKAHFPEYFYTSYLEGASNKQKPLEERHKFIQDAKFFNIKVNRPDLGVSKPWFYSDKHHSILFGLTSIKGVGPSTIESVKKFYEANKDSWIQILVNCLYKLNSRAAQNIVKAGIISNGMQRKKQLHELNILYEVTAKGQITFIFNNCHLYDNLKDLLVAMNKLKKDGGGLHSEKDTEKINGLIYMLENPGYALEDSPEWIASVEEEILGIAISASLLDKTTKNAANVKCKDLLTGMSGYDMMVAAEINMVEQKEIKSGNNKGKIFLKIEFSDKTGTVSSVVWPEVFEKYGDLIKEGNTLCLGIYRDKKNNLVISGAWQI